MSETVGHDTYIYTRACVHMCIYVGSVGSVAYRKNHYKLDIFPHLSDDDCRIDIMSEVRKYQYNVLVIIYYI